MSTGLHVKGPGDARRPVMTRQQLLDVGQRVLRMTTVNVVTVEVTHIARTVTRLANSRVLSSDDGDMIQIQIGTAVNGPPYFNVYTNQLDDTLLLAGVQQCEALLRAHPGYQPDTGMKHEAAVQDTPMPVQLWHDATVSAMLTTRGTILPELIAAVRRERLDAAGFLGLMARATGIVHKDGDLIFFAEDTDSELVVTARDQTAKSLGWAGQAARDWATIDPLRIGHHAIEMAKLGRNPVALEPGRRTAIFTPAAVVQMLRYFTEQFSASDTDLGQTALSKSSWGGNKLRQRIFDPRLTMRSDPNDPEGGYHPFFESGTYALATPPMTWVKDGVLINMAYDIYAAMERGKAYANYATSFRLSGGTTTIEQMIGQCKEGILVNRLADVEMVDGRTCMMTGVTQGGCFFIKNGKVSKPVKNFRFLDSPFFFLNNIQALGAPVRAAFGYTPHAPYHERYTPDVWPRPPIIVPPMMVRDFNFSALVDAV